jgi:hypothetical protein
VIFKAVSKVVEIKVEKTGAGVDLRVMSRQLLTKQPEFWWLNASGLIG